MTEKKLDFSAVPPEIIPVVLCGLIIQYYVKLKSEMKDITDMELRVLMVKQVMGVVGGMYCADLVSGIVHVICDYFLDPIPETDAKTFTGHHEKPKGILNASIYDVYSEIASGSPLPIIISLYQQMNDSPSEWILGNIIFASFAASSQLIHRETHNYNHNEGDGTARTRLYGILSGMGLVMSSDYHKVHHVAEKINFPQVNGWSSPLMNFVVRTTGILD